MTPALSVVVATHDRARRLRELLDSLAAQTLARERFEVIVVDDGSRDGTGAVLDAPPLPITVLRRAEAAGPSVARNEGWRAARAPLIAFTDDDCVATPGWLAALLAGADGDDVVVQGRVAPRPDEAGALGPFSRTLRVGQLGPYFQTANIAYPRAVLERVGGFDANALRLRGEDTDLAWRARAAGARFRFAPDALVHHAVERLGPVGMLRVALRWEESMQVYARHPQLRREALVRGVFWKGSHYLLVRALLSFLLPRRWRPLRWWLAMPYVRHLGDRGRVEGGGLLAAPWWLLFDLVELYAVVRGAVRFRTPVL